MGPPRLLDGVLSSAFPRCCFLILFLSGALGESDTSQTPPAPWNATFTDILKRSLLAGYDKFSRPSRVHISTNVTIGITVFYVGLDDHAGVLTIQGWMELKWSDEKLKWDPSEYGSLTSLTLADHEIWQPDILQYNSASASTVDQYGNTQCVVTNEGVVGWAPPTRFSTFCRMDMSRWPEDEHVCLFVFGSWTFDGSQIFLVENAMPMEKIVNKFYYVDNTEWELVNISYNRDVRFYDCCPDVPYHSVDYSVTVRRRGASRASLLRLLSAAAVLLALLAHWLPPTKAAPRALLSAAPPTIIVMVLFYFAQKLPASKDSPNIVLLYGGSMYLCCASAIVSVCMLNLCRSKLTLPWSVRRAITTTPLSWLAPSSSSHYDPSATEELQSAAGGELSGGASMESSTAKPSKLTPAPALLTLATLIDRIAFITFSLIFLLLLSIYGF